MAAGKGKPGGFFPFGRAWTVAAATAYTIKEFGVKSTAKFPGLVGFVRGFLAGLVILFSYIQESVTEGKISLVRTGLFAFALMILYGVLSGAPGDAVIAFAYRTVLGAKHGIRMKHGPVA